MSEISHLATDKDIVTMGTAIIGAICLVIGGAIGFFTKYFYENKKINESKKSIRQQMITNNIAPMRQAWINDVRSKVSEFIHDSLTLRVEVLAYILHAQKNEPIPITPESREYILFSKINFGSRYLDVLLPFNLPEEERNEEIAESLRKNIIDIRWNFDEIFSSFDEGKYHNLEGNMDNILGLSNEAIENSKKLLLQEWRVTKSLSEIEDK